MFKLFSLAEANKMIPVVSGLLEHLQTDVNDLSNLRRTLAERELGPIAQRNAVQELQFLLSDVHATKTELDRLGVFVQDVDTGVIDFPSQLGAEVVCLRWEQGQDAITHYHRLSEAAPLPLPQPHLPQPAPSLLHAAA